jgi:predicted Zn-dependent protease
MIGGQPFRRAVLTEPEPTRLADAIEVARAAYQAGRIEEARDALDQELKRRTSRPSSGEADLERARAQTLLAILHLASDDRSMAVESATEAVTLLRQAAESGRLPQWCQGDYGIALQITGENDDAIDVLQDAVKIPSLATPDVYRHLGLAYAAKGRFADAEEWLDQTVAAVPGDVMARIAYAEVLAHQDRASDAAAAFAEGAGTARDRPEVAAELADRALLLDRRIG